MAPKKPVKKATVAKKVAPKTIKPIAKPAIKTVAKPVVKVASKLAVKPVAAPVAKMNIKPSPKAKQGTDVIEYLREYALANPAMAVVGLVALLLVMLLIVG